MIQIKLLVDYKSKKAGEIVNISKKGAESAVIAGVAKYVKEEVKQETGEEQGDEKKTYYETKLEMLNKVDDLEEKKKILESIDYSNKIEKEGDAAIIKELQIFLEGIKERIIKQQVEKKVRRVVDSFLSKEDLANQILSIQPLHYDENKIWWLWDTENLKWKISDETDVLNFVRKISTANTINSKERIEILESLKQESRIRKPKPIKKSWIQFKDEIWDIKTGEKFKVSSDYFVTNPIPYKVSGNPLTPVMDKIFVEWVGEKYKLLLYQILAYCLIPDYPINRMFCFIGGGMNGKTCFLNLLKKFIGDENITSTELDILLSSRFEITRLHKKLVCVMGETNFNEMTKTSTIKKLTGQDLIGFEYKNKNPFDDYNYAKILIATNNLPTTTDKTIGFYRRWLIIDFPNQFSEKKDILSEIPEEEYNNLATECVCLLKDLLNKREFDNEGSIEDRVKRYEEHSDPLEKFMKEYTEDDPDGFIWKFEFEKRLNEWCKEKKFRQMSEVVIGKKMKEKRINQELRYSSWGDNKRIRTWVGIKWSIGGSSESLNNVNKMNN